MPQSRGTMFDDFSKLMTDAAEMAHGVRREAETIFKAQIERLLANMDLVTRELAIMGARLDRTSPPHRRKPGEYRHFADRPGHRTRDRVIAAS